MLVVAGFGVFRYNYTGSNGSSMFRTNGEINGFSSMVRPIITLNAGTQAKYDGAYNSTYDKWELK